MSNFHHDLESKRGPIHFAAFASAMAISVFGLFYFRDHINPASLAIFGIVGLILDLLLSILLRKIKSIENRPYGLPKPIDLNSDELGVWSYAFLAIEAMAFFQLGVLFSAPIGLYILKL